MTVNCFSPTALINMQVLGVAVAGRPSGSRV